MCVSSSFKSSPTCSHSQIRFLFRFVAFFHLNHAQVGVGKKYTILAHSIKREEKTRASMQLNSNFKSLVIFIINQKILSSSPTPTIMYNDLPSEHGKKFLWLIFSIEIKMI